MPDTKISAATNTTPPLATDMLPLARVGDTEPRKIMVGNFIANLPAASDVNLGSGSKITVTKPLATNQVFFQIVTPDPLAGNFSIAMDDNNVLNSVRDNTFYIGYNVSTGGVPELVGEIAAYYATEHNWKYGPSNSRLEHYYEIVNTDLDRYRPFGVNYERETDVVNLFLQATNIYFLDQSAGGSSGYFLVQPGVFLLEGAAYFRAEINNVQILRQANVAGDEYVSLIYLNNTDDIILGDSTHTVATMGRLGVGTIDPQSKLHLTVPVSNDAGMTFSQTGVVHWTIGNPAGTLRFDFSSNIDLTAPQLSLHYTGRVGIGTVAPTAALQVVGLAEYADNAAAAGAGLTAGAFYRTGDALKVVHA